jgi:hypothetical protein
MSTSLVMNLRGSTGCLTPYRLSNSAELVSNNHFDQDGLVSVYAL